VLTNTTNGKQISWDGYQIAAGETITIDIPGKTVTSDITTPATDVSTYLSGDTGSFELDPGANALTIFASGGVVTLTTTISVCWYVELLGV
jgi:phage-related protein